MSIAAQGRLLAAVPAPRLPWNLARSSTQRRLHILVFLLGGWEAGVRLLNIGPLVFPPASSVLRAWVSGPLSGEVLR